MEKFEIFLFIVVALFLPSGLVCGQSSSFPNAQQADGMERATWRFEFDNDVFFGSDNGISSGLSLQYHSAAATDWEDLRGVLKIHRRLGRLLPFPKGRNMLCRAGLAIGQLMQTPDDLKRRDLIPEDVPYAGALTLRANWYTYNDEEFHGFEVIVGVAGPLSLAGANQRKIHRLIGSTIPKGWDNQLANEPLLNLIYMRKKKIWHEGRPAGISFDTAINGNVGLGNLFTHASAALEMRFGYNMSGGFIYIPDPIGFSMNHMAALKPARPGAGSFYGSLVLRGTAMAHTIFLDGNSFLESHRVDRDPLVGQIITGLHYEHRDWGVHFYALASSAVVDTHKTTAAEKRELIGSITIERRF